MICAIQTLKLMVLQEGHGIGRHVLNMGIIRLDLCAFLSHSFHGDDS